MDILHEEIMAVDVPCKTKEGVISYLTNLLYEKGYVNDPESFKRDIYGREALGKTGIGNYIAIPHGQSDSVLKNAVAIAQCKNEIPWESLDDKGVKIVFLFCVQSTSDGENEHLKMLAQIAGKLGNDVVVEKLLVARNVEDLKEAFN